jgi:hypothetical protein
MPTAALAEQVPAGHPRPAESGAEAARDGSHTTLLWLRRVVDVGWVHREDTGQRGWVRVRKHVRADRGSVPHGSFGVINERLARGQDLSKWPF